MRHYTNVVPYTPKISPTLLIPLGFVVPDDKDGLVHHSELIDIDGESYRLKEAKERAAQLGAKRKRAKS